MLVEVEEKLLELERLLKERDFWFDVVRLRGRLRVRFLL